MLASVLTANKFEPGVFYAANNKGLFRSADTGLAWDELPIRWPGQIRRVHALQVVAEE
jgi:hypothetical protein